VNENVNLHEYEYVKYDGKWKFSDLKLSVNIKKSIDIFHVSVLFLLP